MPFVILLILMIPVKVALVGTSIGVLGAIPPLVVGATPFFAPGGSDPAQEIDRGIIEASQSMGANGLPRNHFRRASRGSFPASSRQRR